MRSLRPDHGHRHGGTNCTHAGLTPEAGSSWTNNVLKKTANAAEDQLIKEVRGIYAELRKIEMKCIQIDKAQRVRDERKNLGELQVEDLRDLIERHQEFTKREFTKRNVQARQIFEFLEKYEQAAGNRPLKPNLQKGRRKALPIVLKGAEYSACPDSGSEKNIISQELAIRLGAFIRRTPNDQRRFQLGNGKFVRSIGRAYLKSGLVNESRSYKKRCFYVLPKCATLLIMGMDFLDETKVMTTNKHLLKSCTQPMGDTPSVKWIGSPRRRLGCHLDGHFLTAVADTGSDINLISLECAKRSGFHIDRRIEYRTRIQVADGSEADTLGQVRISSLRFGNLGTRSPSHQATDFHVLPGLPCDIILGEPILEKTDAFNAYSDMFVIDRDPSDDDPLELNIFISLGKIQKRLLSLSMCKPKLKRKKQNVPSPSPDISQEKKQDNDDQVEIHRRYQAEEWIAQLSGQAKTNAIANEERRRDAYDQARLKVSKYSSSSQSSSTPSTPSSTSV